MIISPKEEKTSYNRRKYIYLFETHTNLLEYSTEKNKWGNNEKGIHLSPGFSFSINSYSRGLLGEIKQGIL